MTYYQFTDDQLLTLRQRFAGIETASIDSLPQFHRIFDQCHDSALLQLATAKIKFVSKLAVNACVRRNIPLH